MTRRSRLLFGLLLVLLPTSARAQGFHAVSAPDPLDAWAVGDGGIVYRSMDGGSHWASRRLGTLPLRGVATRDERVLIAGDGGVVWRSTDGGGVWSATVAPGQPDWRAITLVSDQVAYAVGAGGAVEKTTDGGDSWIAQPSGTTASLEGVHFADASRGWAVGAGGTVLVTTNGGANWNAMSVGTTRDLHAVDGFGDELWIVGAAGTALRSVDGGITFAAVSLGLDHSLDVRAVGFAQDGQVFLGGGGGFIRRSADGGRHWTYPVHEMHAKISAIDFAGGCAYAASSANRVVLSSLDGGSTWRMPQGATVTRQWMPKLNLTNTVVRGNTFAASREIPGAYYCALGSVVYRSVDEGDTWAPVASIPQGFKVNSFLVTPTIPEVWVASVNSSGKRVVRSTDHGQTWSTVLEHDFGEYSVPLRADPDRPDILYFGGSADVLYRSTDAGLTWSPWSDRSFRIVNGILVVPDSSDVVIVADGVVGGGTAEYWKSTDGGATFSLKEKRPVGTSLIPAMACSRLRNSVAFGTNWGQGGVQSSSDYGESWTSISVEGSTYGIDVAHDDPNVLVFGAYSGGEAYLSLDGGATFIENDLYGVNYAMFFPHRGLALASQHVGIDKLTFTYAYTPEASLDAGASEVRRVALRSSPNPFRSVTKIHYTLPAATDVRLEVFDLQGRRVATLVEGRQTAGGHEVELRLGGNAGGRSGVYFCRLRAGGVETTGRLLRLE
jgi:photosystem II stability/assembly factor-like uncharacterized protein